MLLKEMPFNPRFAYTHAIVRNLCIIERSRAVVDVLPLPPAYALAMRQFARQRATASSTAIEGNNLQSMELVRAVVGHDRSDTDMQQEVRNYWRALEWIEEKSSNPSFVINQDFIKGLHCIILVKGRGRRGNRSNYRSNPCPVVNTVTGAVEYAPPYPKDVPRLMEELEEWMDSERAASLPAPVRSAILAHRFVSIHPFPDGNGRTARALATSELWKSGYELKGFLSIEEHFASDRETYYKSIQMGLDFNFYEGRHDPDHTQWIEYVTGVMAKAADTVRIQAESFHKHVHNEKYPWERLSRRQQQLLTRLLTAGIAEGTRELTFSSADMEEWYGVSRPTAREWLSEWRSDDFVQPSNPESERVKSWKLTPRWNDFVLKTVGIALERRRESPQVK
ncbi:MAG: Fic family protein [Opitutales bacterium]|nr:Fic family protein [Opitutales bacterium]